MPGPWITTDDLKQALADGLKKDVGDLKPYWDRIIVRCLERGTADVANYLSGKGYTNAQLDAWDDRAVYTRDQSLFFCYVEGGGPEDQTDRDVKRLDRVTEFRKDGDGIAIRISGVMTPPGGTDTAAGMGAGRLAIDNAGVDYGTTFGLRVNRQNGRNQYGDQLPDGFSQDGPYGYPPNW